MEEYQIDSVDLTTQLKLVLQKFAKKSYSASQRNHDDDRFNSLCLSLFKKDYPDSFVVPNSTEFTPGGPMCEYYPAYFIIPQCAAFQQPLQPSLLRHLMHCSRHVRCRSCFAAPAMLFENKLICRSATLSTQAEIVMRDLLFPEEMKISSKKSIHAIILSASEQANSRVVDEWRFHDKRLLDYLGITQIVDLMVEGKKKKYRSIVSSSEKADSSNRYERYSILVMPYPGCEYFNNYYIRGLRRYNPLIERPFCWSDPANDAPFSVAPELLQRVGVDYTNYQSWNIVELTCNYLKLLISETMNKKSGNLLMHCISGRDRTPILITLLRISLWADGLVHQTLSAIEVTFLSVAYDWYLFGHPLKMRYDRCQELLRFCFDVLQFIVDDSFAASNFSDQNGLSMVLNGFDEADNISQGSIISQQDFSSSSIRSSVFSNNASVVDEEEGVASLKNKIPAYHSNRSCSTRKEKVDSVRLIFLHLYDSFIGPLDDRME